MLDIGFGELIVIAIIALLVFGPDRLPKVASDAAKSLRQIRHMAASARRDLADAAGLDDDPELAQTVRDLRDLDPRRALRGLGDEVTDRSTAPRRRSAPGSAPGSAAGTTAGSAAAGTAAASGEPGAVAPGSSSPAGRDGRDGAPTPRAAESGQGSRAEPDGARQQTAGGAGADGAGADGAGSGPDAASGSPDSEGAGAAPWVDPDWT